MNTMEKSQCDFFIVCVKSYVKNSKVKKSHGDNGLRLTPWQEALTQDHMCTRFLLL